jgi:hypothetical protein
MGDATGDLVASGPCFTLRREPNLLHMRLFGELDDRRSKEWRTALAAELAAGGAPRFVAFDTHDADARSSMTTRLVTAGYVREMLKRFEWAALLVPVATGGSVAVRIIMGIVRTQRISMVTSREAFQEALEQMRLGERPRP